MIDQSDRTTGITKIALEDVRIEFGRILDIHPERGTVDFRSEMSEQYRYDIPYAMPYFDQTEGSGIYFNPEVGTTAICMTTSDNRSLILAFMGLDEDGSYLSGRPASNPGDIFITGRDGNFLSIRRGGIIQIGAKPICQTVYIPTRNIIQNFSENFELYTLAGEMKFSVDRPEDSSEGHSKVKYSLNVKEYSDDKTEIAKLLIGSQPDNLVFSLTTKDSGNGSVKITVSGDKEGTLNISLEKNFNIKVKGDTNITTTGKTNIKSTDDLTIETSAALNLKSRNFIIKGDISGEINTNGLLTVKAGTIKLTDAGQFPVLRMTPDMGLFLGACAAMAKVPFPPSAINTNVLV